MSHYVKPFQNITDLLAEFTHLVPTSLTRGVFKMESQTVSPYFSDSGCLQVGSPYGGCLVERPTPSKL